MPLSLIKDVNATVSYALWHIEESLDEMAGMYPFTASDREILDRYKVESRKTEWLAARLALRALMKARELEDQPIVKDEFGKPHITNNRAQISISHTEHWGAAALSTEAAVGIDIEKPRNQIKRIARKFLHAQEADWAGHDLNRLTKIWCAKEALYKLHGRTQLIFAEQLLISQSGDQLPSGRICENGLEENHLLYYDQVENLHICLAH